MNIREYIILTYADVRNNYNFKEINSDENEIEYVIGKQDNYIDTNNAINKFIETLHPLNHYDKDLQLSKFMNVLRYLIGNCIIEGIKPAVSLNEMGFGYDTFDYREEEQRTMQFLEGYLKCQTPKWDVIHWVELGIKIGILNFNNKTNEINA